MSYAERRKRGLVAPAGFGYLRAISTAVGRGFNVPENCEAITTAATIAGTQISLIN